MQYMRLSELGLIRCTGRQAGFGGAERRGPVRFLKEGARAAGFPGKARSLPHVRTLINRRFAHRYSEVPMWRLHRVRNIYGNCGRLEPQARAFSYSHSWCIPVICKSWAASDS
jgi:hypothetical protein